MACNEDSGWSGLIKHHGVVDHVEEYGGNEAACFAEEQAVDRAEQKDGRPGEQRVVNGEEGGCAEGVSSADSQYGNIWIDELSLLYCGQNTLPM